MKRDGGDRGLASLATAQSGLVSLDQAARSLNTTRRAVSYRTEDGRLHRVHRGVYAVGHEAYGRRGELKAALLACGEGAVLSHLTAAAFWELRDRWPALIDVTGPEQRGRKIDGVRCRRCRCPDSTEVVALDGLVLTSPSRTMVDLAGVLGDASLRKLVERAALRKLLDLRALDTAMARAKGRRGIAALRAILEDWRSADGSVPDLRSEFEALVLPRLLALGVPRPGCNVPLRLEGERLVIDFLWDEQRLVVETDGRATHETPPAFQSDRRRDQVLVAAGYRVVRVTWRQIEGELEGVVGRVSRALAVTR